MAPHKGDVAGGSSTSKTLDAIDTLQQSQQITKVRLQQVEEASKIFVETQRKLDEKVGSILKLLLQWNSSSEAGSAQKTHPFTNRCAKQD
jgi:hypothetical protein